MISTKIKVQIALFIVISLVGISYAGAEYARLDTLFGERGYKVTLRLPDSGGVFTNAEVTYRGIAVGRVSQLNLTDSGVAVELDIENTSLRIPADTNAVVANRSAIGEQYVDLQPTSNGGPYLQAGSVIPANRAELPPRPEKLLTNLNNFVTSVPTGSLRKVVDELHAGFNGRGDDLERILEASRSFTREANRHLPQTASLLSHGRRVLQTQQDLADPIKSFSSDLNKVTDQLVKSDRDVRRLIDSAPKVANQVTDLLRDSGQNLGALFANLLTTANIAAPRTGGLEQVLVAYPMVMGIASTAVNPRGVGHLGVNLQVFDPPVCTTGGYQQTPRRPGSDTREAPPNNNAYCSLGPGNPTGVRGSQNAPVAGKPVTPPISGSAMSPGVGGPGDGGQPPVSGLRELLGLPG